MTNVDKLARLLRECIERQQAQIEHLTDKLNRVEAKVAHEKPAAPAGQPVNVAIELLDRAVAALEQQNDTLRNMMMDVRRAR
jgi:hypothetical protein